MEQRRQALISKLGVVDSSFASTAEIFLYCSEGLFADQRLMPAKEGLTPVTHHPRVERIGENPPELRDRERLPAPGGETTVDNSLEDLAKW